VDSPTWQAVATTWELPPLASDSFVRSVAFLSEDALTSPEVYELQVFLE
jgi:hypothetical protein